MTARCFFCGEPAAEGEDPRNALCEVHKPIHEHRVSIQRQDGPATFVAACKCGWRSESETYFGREDEVDAHWRSIVGEAVLS